MKAQNRLRAQPMRVSSAKSVTSNIGCATSSGSYDTAPAVAGKDYLAFVVQDYSGNWRYVRVMQHAVDCMNAPHLFHESAAEEMIALWKRIVIDGAIPWEDSVLPETLRIIRYRVDMQDVTASLFTEDDEVFEVRRTVALAKLTDDEARLLGLTQQKAKQKLMRDPEFGGNDGRLLKGLAQCISEFNLDSALREHLSDD